ncbi:chorismate--pyruvate lyase family protein [Sphingomonas sp. RS2018]
MLLTTDAVARLEAELAAAASATEVLQRRCPHDAVRAVVDRSLHRAPSPEQRRLLDVEDDELVAYRCVRLVCGSRTLSRAENWYVPARLTPAMNTALEGDTPFGAVIRRLGVTRRILSRQLPDDGDTVLQLRALVVPATGRPIAEVIENYTREVLD